MQIETGLFISMLVGVINLILGFFIFLKDKRNLVNIFYFLLSLSISIWAFAVGIGRNAEFLPTLLIWAKIAYLAAAASAMFFLYFTFVFPSKENFSLIKKILPFLVFIFLSFLMVLKFDSFIVTIKTLNHKPLISNIIFLFGWVYVVYSIYTLFFFTAGLYYLFFKYRKARDITKTQIKYILLGSLSTITLAILSNLMPWSGMLKYNYFGPMFTMVMVVSMAYAITKHQLFNIKVIATELLVGLVSLVLLVELVSADSLPEMILKLAILVSFIYLGWSLIQSVFKEIERREKLESLTNRLKTANVRLRRLDKAKSEFVSIASHQLRTPLTSIKGFISMVLDGSYGKLSRKVREPIKSVYNSNERLIRLVNDLLNISKIEAETIVLIPEKIAVGDLVESVVQELKLEARKKSLIIKFKKPKRLPKTLLDKSKIRQVILNILDNAIKYTNQGHISVTIKQEDEDGDKKEKRIIVSIADTGEGMTQKEIDSLFQSFSRGTAGSRLWTEGAGLGLYVAKKFVEMHNGKVWAESKGKKKGSTFHIELPIK